MQDLGTLGGTYSAAFAISETGEVTGESSDGGLKHAFLWRDGVMQDLGLLPGYSASPGIVINPRGDVAGQTSDPSKYGVHAFFWSDGALRDLGTLGGPSTIVQALGARGQVAGDRGEQSLKYDSVIAPVVPTAGRLFSGAWATARGTAAAPSSPPSPSPTIARRSRSG